MFSIILEVLISKFSGIAWLGEGKICVYFFRVVFGLYVAWMEFKYFYVYLGGIYMIRVKLLNMGIIGEVEVGF